MVHGFAAGTAASKAMTQKKWVNMKTKNTKPKKAKQTCTHKISYV